MRRLIASSRIRNAFRGLLAAALLACWTTAIAAPLRVVHPQVESRNDLRAGFPLAVLELALERSGVPYALSESATPMQQGRALRALKQGRLLDVVWTVSTPERERGLRPVRIPIDRGLIGWRVLLVQADQLPRYASIRRIGDLAPYVAVQGHDWPDLAVLRANGLRTVANPTYEGLFAMLRYGRIDYLPRGAGEVRAELALLGDGRIAIEPHLLLHYPLPLYFFVHADNERLARAIEDGLERAIADGSHAALFDAAYGGDIESLGLRTRTVIPLSNPQLPPATPVGRPALWFDPTEP